MLKPLSKIIILVFVILIIVLSPPVSLSAEELEPENSDDVYIFEFEDIIIEDIPVEEGTDIKTAQITVFDREAIEASGARTAADVIERAPGVVVSRKGGILEPQSVSIRGGSSNHVLVLIDGKPADSLWSGASDLGVSVSNIERIEVIRGAAAAVYGEGAVSGVINIITVKKETDVGSAEFEYGFASFNTHQLNIDLSSVLDYETGLSGGFSAGGLYTGGDYEYEVSDEQAVRSNNDGWTADSSVSLTGDNFSAGAGLYASERGSPGVMEFLTPDARVENIKGSLSYDYNLETDTNGSFSAEADGRYNFSSYTNPSEDLSESNENAGVDVSGKWVMDYDMDQLFLGVSVSSGYSFDYLNSTALTDSTGSLVGGDAVQQSADLRMNISTEFGKFDLIPAAGLDWFFTDYSAAGKSADIAVSWSAAAGFSPFRTDFEEGPLYLKLNVGSAYKNPSFQDLFWPSGALAAGNPDLLPETSFNFDGGLFFTFAGSSGEPSVRIEAVGFFTDSKDLIQWLPSAGGIWRPINVGSVHSSGAEFSTELRYPEVIGAADLKVNAVYNWLRCIDADESSVNYGKQLAYKPEHSGNISTRLTFPGSLTFELAGSYLGYRFTNNANTKFIDQVFLLSAALNYDFNEIFGVSASVDNILDQSYIDKLGYPVPGIEWAIKGSISL